MMRRSSESCRESERRGESEVVDSIRALRSDEQVNTAIVIVIAVIVATAIGAYVVWPDRFVMNVIRSARQKKAQPSLNELSIGQLTKRAQAGDAAAQYRVGYLHATGDGVPVDYAKANYWFQRAVQAGVVDKLKVTNALRRTSNGSFGIAFD